MDKKIRVELIDGEVVFYIIENQAKINKTAENISLVGYDTTLGDLDVYVPVHRIRRVRIVDIDDDA